MDKLQNLDSSIYISYRREDSSEVLQIINPLRDQLKSLFSENLLFLDSMDLLPGVDLPDALGQALRNSKIILVFIGKNWLENKDQTGKRRIENPDDWIRKEIRFGIENGKEVIPILINNTKYKYSNKEILPTDLHTLANVSALHIDTNKNLYEGIEVLVSIILEVLTKHLKKTENIFLKPVDTPISVFISYSRKNSSIAQKLKLDFEEHGIEVIIDQDDLSAGKNIQKFIEESISATSKTISIVSKDSLHTSWLMSESINSLLVEKTNGKSKFIACYLDENFLDRNYPEQVYNYVDN